MSSDGTMKPSSMSCYLGRDRWREKLASEEVEEKTKEIAMAKPETQVGDESESATSGLLIHVSLRTFCLFLRPGFPMLLPCVSFFTKHVVNMYFFGIFLR